MVKENKYDAVLMDIQMPEMDGLTATRFIREDEQFRELPILAMTAHAMKGEYEKSIAAGMNDHITKPIDPVVLYKTLSQYVDKSSGAPAAALVSAPVAAELLPTIAEELQIEGIDLPTGLSRVAGKKDVYTGLLKRFTATYANIMEAVAHMLNEDQFNALERYMHTLAGVSGNLAMDELYREAYKISAELKKHGSVAEFSDDLKKSISALAQKVVLQADRIIASLKGSPEKQTKRISPTVSQPDYEENMRKLILLVENYDSRASEYCMYMINNYSHSATKLSALNQMLDALNNYDYEKAMKVMN